MFLLRLWHLTLIAPLWNTFTFQYVSIKTDWTVSKKPLIWKFTFQYVSIKTNIISLALLALLAFTFQYVSIKTLEPRF